MVDRYQSLSYDTHDEAADASADAREPRRDDRVPLSAVPAAPRVRPPLASGPQPSPVGAMPREAIVGERSTTPGAMRWATGFAIVLALHVGLGAYLMSAAREALEGSPDDTINVELTPDSSQDPTKAADAGLNGGEASAPTSEQARADDPNPPAPEAPPPTQAQHKPETPPDVAAPPVPDAKPELQAQKPEDRPPDPMTPSDDASPDAKQDKVEQKSTPTQAGGGNAGGGGRRLSSAAKRTWAGEIGRRLVRNRRFPQEALSKGWEGTARVKVTLDGKGHVLGRELVKGTGRAILDDEALALVQRSDPFPQPPEGMATPVVMTVPVNFNIH